MCEPDLTVFLSFSHMIYQAYSNISAPVCDRDFRFINFRRTGSMQNFTVRHIIINEIIHRQHIQYLFYLNIIKIPNLSCRSFLRKAVTDRNPCLIIFVRRMLLMIFLQAPHQRVCDIRTVCIACLFQRQDGQCNMYRVIPLLYLKFTDTAGLCNQGFLFDNGCLKQKTSCIPALQFKVYGYPEQFFFKRCWIDTDHAVCPIKAMQNVFGTAGITSLSHCRK